MSSNGVGVGHLSRLLSIARRLPEGIDAVFLTMSQALAVAEQFGFHAEYFPCFRSGQSDFDDWNEWLKLALDQILEAYDIGAVVFDGNMLYPGLCNAVQSHRKSRLIWIRRGMWRAGQKNEPHIELGKHADLIIEPDDIAADFDRGASAELRSHLDREESCDKLGLDPQQKHVLIQLGAGNNYNFIDLMDHLIDILRSSGETNPVIAEWLTADVSLDFWPDLPRICCFPISRFFRAFDFTVSAAGYNSFNEIISFGVPSILVPNLNRAMDDQTARAAFAASHGAAIHLDSPTRNDLEDALTTIESPEYRQNLSSNCSAIAKPNGAEDAARLICECSGLAV
jgi:UDP:flavonoid glycosyltransferase YjiC (YdhE family)